MPLTSLLYRCPRCGHDPTRGVGDGARCPACGTRFSRGRGDGRIRVTDAGGSVWELTSGSLTAAIDALGGPGPRARDGQGRIHYQAEVTVREAREEAPVRFRGELLGFAETPGDPASGVLEITEEGLTFTPEGEAARRWLLVDVRAVQTSSSSLQISPREGGLVEFRFLADSPRRWEDLLHIALREAYRRLGRGEITEFQPRILTSP